MHQHDDLRNKIDAFVLDEPGIALWAAMAETKTVSVCDRREPTGALISDAAYNLLIGLVIGWGLWVNYLMVQSIPAEWLLAVNPRVLLIGYFVLVVTGAICTASNNAATSFLGYNLIVLPVGLLLVRFLADVAPAVIARACFATGMVTASMMLLAIMYSGFFLNLRRGLMVALLVAIVVELGSGLLTGTFPPVFDWIFVLIFSGYIGHDWAQAQQLPKTLDNAVDSGVSVYLDIINLFLRLIPDD